MKKIALLCIGFLFAATSFAQQGFHIGVKGGMLGTYMYNQDLTDTEKNYVESRFKFASAFAVTTNYHFSETVGLGVDFNFATLAQDYTFYSSGNIDADLSAKYLRVPLLLHFNSDPGSSVMFKGFFGPQLSLLTSATMTNNYVIGSGSEDPLVVVDGQTGVSYTYLDRAALSTYAGDVKGAMESSTIGAVLGLGFAINATEYLNVDIGVILGYDFTDAGTPFQPVDVPRTESDFRWANGAPTSAPTNNITGGFNVGINYILN